MVSGELLQKVVFNTSIMSVTMDASEYRLFAGGTSGDIYTVNMYGQVRLLGAALDCYCCCIVVLCPR